jgi:hypothetical protein
MGKVVPLKKSSNTNKKKEVKNLASFFVSLNTNSTIKGWHFEILIN